jgi:hypothetical protein
LAISRTAFWLLLILLLSITGCTELRPTPTLSEVVVTSTTIASSTLLPTVTPTIPITPSSILTPTPMAESHWQCDPSGGVACFAALGAVAMLNAQEGWAFGSGGMVFRYMIVPESNTPTWQRVPDLTLPGYVNVFTLVSDTEGWGVLDGTILHYQDGVWEVVPTPGTTRLVDIAMLNENEGWAVGDNGIILHYVEGEWRSVPGPTNLSLAAIDMLNTEEGWAVGVFGELLHYYNHQWEKVNIPDGLFRDIDMVNEQEGWIVGDDVLLHYHNGTWEEVTTELAPYPDLSVVSMVNAEEGWAMGKNGRILHYNSGRWQAYPSPTENGLGFITMVSVEEGWAMGANSTILHYQNGVWELVSEAKPYNRLTDVDWLDNGEGWAVGSSTVLQYVAGEWQPVDIPPGTSALAIDMVSPEEGWTVSVGGTILHYTQGTWQLVPSSTTQDLNDLDMVNENEGWAVGAEGIILHYTNDKWHEVASPTTKWLEDIAMVNEQEGWTVGLRGTILHYQAGNWQESALVVDKHLTEIEMIDENTGWILAGDLLLHYENSVWQEITPPSEYNSFSAMGVVGADEVWVMGKRFILRYKAGEWEVFDNPRGLGMARMLMLNENEGWAVGDGILHYTNK